MQDREINIKLVYKKGLPEQIKGATAHEGEDRYKMIINGDLDETEQAAAFIHECVHILNRDFLKEEPVTEIETKVHEQLKALAEKYIQDQEGDTE